MATNPSNAHPAVFLLIGSGESSNRSKTGTTNASSFPREKTTLGILSHANSPARCRYLGRNSTVIAEVVACWGLAKRHERIERSADGE